MKHTGENPDKENFFYMMRLFTTNQEKNKIWQMFSTIMGVMAAYNADYDASEQMR